MRALLLLGAVVLVAGAAWLSYIRKAKRRQTLASFARKFGFSFRQTDPFNLLWDYNFPLFEMGDGRGCENVVWGEWKGIPFRETDYWYFTKSTNSNGDNVKSYKHFNAVVVDIPAYVPVVTIERETFATRLADQVGWRDIQFESGEFNRAFRVTAQDREFAFKLVDARMMQWLLTTPQGFGFQFRGSAFLVFSHRLRPMELLPLVGTGKELYDHIPRLVWTDYGTGPTRTNEAMS